LASQSRAPKTENILKAIHMKLAKLTLTLPAIMAAITSCCIGQTSQTVAVQGARSVELNLVQYAKPMCGTGGDAFTYPGATVPFGMIQWSPDTEMGLRKGGYSDDDTRISDFSVDHISGAGCSYGEDFAMMPIMGRQPASPPDKRTDFAAPFSHTNEVATPGYYGVTFDNGLKAELAATMRTGFGRFTYPGSDAATLMINAASDINTSDASIINVNPATREVSGSSLGGHFCHAKGRQCDIRTIYFYAVFDHPFSAFSTWSDNTLTNGMTNGAGTKSGAYITFDTSSGRTVLVKIGISYVSVDNAKANVQAENPVSAFSSKDFDQAAAAASHTWNSWLNKIQVSGGTVADKETFYSMFYHTLLGPIVVSDANGEYYGYDGHVHQLAKGRAQYGMFSGWDIYRSECQFLAMVAPHEASDMAQTLLVDYQQGGAFPRWGVLTEDSGVMLGDPAACMIADFYAFGATNFDTKAALAGLVRAATDPSVEAPRSKTHERDALDDYLKLGYVPEHVRGGNVSLTLEYDSADFALSQFARSLGDDADSAMLLQHAQNWRNHYNPETGYLAVRRRDGSWAPGSTNVGLHAGERAYVEGTAGQYLWMVPFNLKGLADTLGGPEIAAKRLDEFFTQINGGFNSPYAYLGNEPCLETPWIYDFLGQPWKTQRVVRQAVTELYSANPQGYPGNDDVGAMSSWWLFGALGMYPELPGSDVLVCGSPLFPKAALHLPHGDVTVIGGGASANAPYVQALTINGQPSNRPWFRYADISHGGTLVYTLGQTPNTHWGSNPADAPPSYQ
jgi:predicted alpha-1,2-mannosidase